MPVDAPQTITVTVRTGGIDLHVAPGLPRAVLFTTTTSVTPRAGTQTGGSWLSVALDGTGSFRFAHAYRVRLQPDVSLAEGTYNGSVTASGSSVATI